MAWVAEVISPCAIDYNNLKLIVFVEFYDTVDRPGTSYRQDFQVPYNPSTDSQVLLNDLVSRVQARGSDVKKLTDYRNGARTLVPVGAQVAIS